MEFRQFEIKLISADDIKNVNIFTKMNVYAEVLISSHPQTKKKTNVDKDCGTRPKWNQKLQFTIDERSISIPGSSLLIHLKAKKTFMTDKDIGKIVVPIAELFKNVDDGNDLEGEKVVEYQVRTSSGRSKGVVKFSYRFGEKIKDDVEVKMGDKDEPVTAYPPPVGYDVNGKANGTPVVYLPPHTGMGYQQSPPAGYNNVAPMVYPPPHAGTGYQQSPPTGYKDGQTNGTPMTYPPPHAGTGYQQLPPTGYKDGQTNGTPIAYPPPHSGMGYQQSPPGGYPGYGHAPPPPQGYYGTYPTPGGYPPHPGYGYAPPQGYVNQPPAPAKKKKNGMGMGLGIGAGLLGGMLLGDMVSDVGEMAAYNEGYEDAMDNSYDF